MYINVSQLKCTLRGSLLPPTFGVVVTSYRTWRKCAFMI